MGINFDALVLGPCMAVFAWPAVATPVASSPSTPPFPIRGIFALKPSDIVNEDGTTRADDYTFSVRASELPMPLARNDRLSDIVHPSFQAFLAGQTFVIDDTGDDGMGNQTWVLKRQRLDNDEP